MKNRFLIPEYITFSLKLKWRERNLRRKSMGMSPYTKYKSVAKILNRKYPFNKVEEYTALTHFNHKQACDFYGELTFITTVIIKALIYWNEKDRHDDTFINMVEEIILRAEGSDSHLKFFIELDMDKLTLEDRCISGIVQGKALSLLVRAYWLTGNERYRALAEKCYRTLLIPMEQSGPLRTLNENHIWSEEYPDLNHPSMVLNGHLFTIIGISDFLQINPDQSVNNFYNKIINTTLAYLPFYIHGDVILYSMFDWKPCNVHYLGIMQPLCAHIYKVTEADEFENLNQWLIKHCPTKVFNTLLGLN